MRGVLALGLVACSGGPPAPVDDALRDPVPLRDLAEARGFRFGTALDARTLVDEPLYGEIAGYQFNVIVAENEMKMAALQRAEGTYDFARSDPLIDFAEAHQMAVRGHTLVYPNGSPDWLLDGSWDAASLTAVMNDHITTVMTRYQGRVAAWDVVNEPLDYDAGDPEATFDDKVFTQVLGEQYVDVALTTARAADATAKLFINENGIERPGPKLTRLAALAGDSYDRGLLDGVGMEFHVPLDLVPDVDAALVEIDTAMRALTALGLEIHVTELDIRLELPADAAALAKQAALYAGIVRTCLANPGCTALLVWGFTDRHSWIPGQYPGYGEACLLDDTYALKPAYHAVHDELAR